MNDLNAGGIPPFGQDFNGIFYDITLAEQFVQAGGSYVYDSGFATAIGGYPLGALVQRSDGSGFWRNTVADNTTDPDAGGAGWQPEEAGITPVTMTSSNVTLTSLQAARNIIVITGTLTTNLNLVFPAYTKGWTVSNQTTGIFSITCKTAAGSGVIVSQSASTQIWGDGTNIQYATGSQSVVLRGYIDGLIMSTAGSSATMSIGAGQAADSTNSVNLDLLSGINKTTSAWAVGSGNGGLDTGSIANGTWYYFYVIRRPDTGVVDIVFSTNSTAPTLPASYTQYRYIGAGFTNGGAQWTRFVQDGNYFRWYTPVLDIDAATGTTAGLSTLSVPMGRKMLAKYNVYTSDGTTGAGRIYLSDPDVEDLAPSVTAAPLSAVGFNGAVSDIGIGFGECFTNTSAQIRRRGQNANTFCRLATLGWVDMRGKQ
jgi:hypothetical protein